MNNVETLTSSNDPASQPFKHSLVLPRTSYISKNFVAYIEALVCTAPYFETTPDARNKLDARFAKAFKELDRQEDQRFVRGAQAQGLVHHVSLTSAPSVTSAPSAQPRRVQAQRQPP